MEDLQFPWLNLHDHDHQEQIFDFDSENMFYNPIHQLSPTNWGDQEIPTDLVYNNGFRSEIKNSSLLSGTNSSIDGSDGISIILSNSKGLKSDNIIVGNNNISGVSSGDSVDDGVVSKCSSRKRLISQVEVSDNDYNKLVNCTLNPHKQKRSRSNTGQPVSSNINFQQPGNQSETDTEAIAQMKEMIYREAAFRPVNLATEILVEKPKRKNVRISSDPQTVAARQRRERISERIRVLQKLVPGGNKMDTASMLDEAANYLKFLRSQVNTLEQIRENGTIFNAHGTNDASQISHHHRSLVVPFTQNPFSMQTHFSFAHENLYPNEGRV